MGSIEVRKYYAYRNWSLSDFDFLKEVGECHYTANWLCQVASGIKHDAKRPRHVAGERAATLATVGGTPNLCKDVVDDFALLLPGLIAIKETDTQRHCGPTPLILLLMFDRKGGDILHGRSPNHGFVNVIAKPKAGL